MCLNHPDLVQKHPTHLASSVVVCLLEPPRSSAEVPYTALRWCGSAYLTEPHNHRESKVCRVLMH